MRGNSFEPDFRDVTSIIAACFPDGEPPRITAPVRASRKKEPHRESRTRPRRSGRARAPETEQRNAAEPDLQ